MAEKSPWWLIIVAAVLFVGYAIAVFVVASNWRVGFLSIISGLFGFLLKYGGFGFTCTFREMVTNADFSQYRNMLIMLFFATGLCSLIEAINGLHPLFDPTRSKSFSDSGAQVGVSVMLGAFFFGIGMIMGSGCASGTFVGIGEGFIKAYVVLPFFVIGATLCASNPFYRWWSELPKSKEVIRIDFGFTLLILMILFGLTYFGDWIKSKVKKDVVKNDDFAGMRRLFSMDNNNPTNAGTASSTATWYRSMLYAAAIGCVVALFYLCDGSMIGVMGVFPKVGASILQWFGAHPEKWDYFQKNPLPHNYLDVDIFNSNIFMALGAFLASAILGNFGKSQKHGVWEYTKAVIGGLLMGIGARMANGCNIGAMTSGITSSSISGFVWMFSAILGCLVTCHLLNFIEGKCCKKPEGINTYTPVE